MKNIVAVDESSVTESYPFNVILVFEGKLKISGLISSMWL